MGVLYRWFLIFDIFVGFSNFFFLVSLEFLTFLSLFIDLGNVFFVSIGNRKWRKNLLSPFFQTFVIYFVCVSEIFSSLDWYNL